MIVVPASSLLCPVRSSVSSLPVFASTTREEGYVDMPPRDV